MNIEFESTCEVCFTADPKTLEADFIEKLCGQRTITCMPCTFMMTDMITGVAQTRFQELQRAAISSGRSSQASTLQKILMATMRSRQGR